jgi:hypothetical protein
LPDFKEKPVNKKPYIKKQLHELLYQALETERGGIKIYETALSCAQNKDPRAGAAGGDRGAGTEPRDRNPRAGSGGSHRGFAGHRDGNGDSAR